MTTRLELLQRLSDEGSAEELQNELASCSAKELRNLCAKLGARVQSKAFAAYNSKAGHTKLLRELLAAKNKGTRPVVVGRTRKTKNCNLRLVNVMLSDVLTPLLSQMNARPSQKEQADGAVGGNSPFWRKVQEEFVSDREEYATIACPESCFDDYNLENPVLHSSDKLRKMWGELWAAFASASARVPAAEVHDTSFLGACPNRYDVYYLRRCLDLKPELLAALSDGTSTDQSTAPSDSDDARDDHTIHARKRNSSAVDQLGDVIEAIAKGKQSKDEQRLQLLQSIKTACETLILVGATPGPEIEHVVRDELQQCVKRLKTLQSE